MKRNKTPLFTAAILSLSAAALCNAQDISRPPLPAPLGIPVPGPVTSAPYAPQPILPGGSLFRSKRRARHFCRGPTRIACLPAVVLKDLNCHRFDPNKEFVLNPKAWSDPAPGQWGTAARYYDDYRNARRPDEEVSFGRSFRVRERMNFSVRALFYNVCDRTYLQVPDSTNAQASQFYNSAGAVQSGFGRINTQSPYCLGPRNSILEARFTF